MPRSGSSIHLLVPGLFGPMPALEQSAEICSVPGLETLLARSDCSAWPGRDLETTLLSFCALDRVQGRDYPIAALRRVGDGGSPDRSFWLQANPVHLRADRDRLLLFGSEDLALSQREAEQLALLVENHFVAQGWRIEVVLPHRWYLTLDKIPAISTHSLDDVLGRNIDQFLPAGDDSLHWHGLINEIQMLLYSDEVNRKRDEQGQLSVNGIWFSGGGCLPESSIGLPFDQVFANESLARGLALTAVITPHAFPGSSGSLRKMAGGSLVVYDELRPAVLRVDPGGWRDALIALDNWLDDLIQGVRQKQPGELLLYPCNGEVYRLRRSALRRFWRRPKQLGGYLNNQSQLGPVS